MKITAVKPPRSTVRTEQSNLCPTERADLGPDKTEPWFSSFSGVWFVQTFRTKYRKFGWAIVKNNATKRNEPWPHKGRGRDQMFHWNLVWWIYLVNLRKMTTTQRYVLYSSLVCRHSFKVKPRVAVAQYIRTWLGTQRVASSSPGWTEVQSGDW